MRENYTSHLPSFCFWGGKSPENGNFWGLRGCSKFWTAACLLTKLLNTRLYRHPYVAEESCASCRSDRTGHFSGLHWIVGREAPLEG